MEHECSIWTPIIISIVSFVVSFPIGYVFGRAQLRREQASRKSIFREIQ